MATTQKTMNNNKRSNKTAHTMLEQFIEELNREIDAKEAGVSRKITKGQALVKSMVNEALKGDQKMLANVLKLIDRLDAAEPEEKKNEVRQTKTDWELTFAFYGKYKALIEQEIERLKKSNPSYWSFEWFRPTLESAPWYEEIYGKKSG